MSDTTPAASTRSRVNSKSATEVNKNAKKLAQKSNRNIIFPVDEDQSPPADAKQIADLKRHIEQLDDDVTEGNQKIQKLEISEAASKVLLNSVLQQKQEVETSLETEVARNAALEEEVKYLRGAYWWSFESTIEALKSKNNFLFLPSF